MAKGISIMLCHRKVSAKLAFKIESMSLSKLRTHRFQTRKRNVSFCFRTVLIYPALPSREMYRISLKSEDTSSQGQRHIRRSRILTQKRVHKYCRGLRRMGVRVGASEENNAEHKRGKLRVTASVCARHRRIHVQTNLNIKARNDTFRKQALLQL